MVEKLQKVVNEETRCDTIERDEGQVALVEGIQVLATYTNPTDTFELLWDMDDEICEQLPSQRERSREAHKVVPRPLSSVGPECDQQDSSAFGPHDAAKSQWGS